MKIAIALLVVFSQVAANADIIDVYANGGINGVEGENGDPGLNGGDGTDGDSISYSTVFNEAGANRLSVYGGSGGRGGDGGDGVDGPDPDSSADGGNGGHAGNGGDAIAVTETTEVGGISFNSYTSAFGGYGGSGGFLGSAFFDGMRGLGGEGGSGGMAHASTDISSDSVVDSAFVEVFARAGNAGTSRGGPGMRGGNALAELMFDLDVDYSSNIISESRGGDGGFSFDSSGGDGGSAVASMSVSSEFQLPDIYPIVQARVSTRGGDGGGGRGFGNSGGDGGVAQSTAEVFELSGAGLTAVISETGGSGGDGSEGADGGAGADAYLNNEVQGTSTGTFEVFQTAEGGNGGSSDDGMAGLGGTAHSIINTGVREEATTRIGVFATGGDGGGSNAGAVSGLDGSVGFAEATAISEGNLTVTASAYGGNGGNSRLGQSGNGVAGQLGEVHGVTLNGGFMTVEAAVHGGNGGDSYGAGTGGDGAHVSLNNAVSGETTGTMALAQRAFGGNGGSTDGAQSGAAGMASSTLTYEADIESLQVVASAYGGRGGNALNSTGLGSDGADAEAFSEANNTGGSGTAVAESQGGRGGSMFSSESGSNGGDAVSHAIANTSESGERAQAIARAYGGDAEAGFFGQSLGGAATAIAEASGSGSVLAGFEITRAEAEARGGDDEGVASMSGEEGGLANSHAEAHTTGAEDVIVESIALGGDTSYSAENSQGNAFATATGTSTGAGDVEVLASQHSGDAADGASQEAANDGLDSVMIDAVSGFARTRLELRQLAFAGAGQDGGDASGDGGHALSTFSADVGNTSDVFGLAKATGGNGGDAFFADSASVGIGGGATASINLSASGRVTAVAEAFGGDSGIVGNPPNMLGRGGDAISTAIAESLNDSATANADAFAGEGIAGQGDGTAIARSYATAHNGNTSTAQGNAFGRSAESLAQATTSDDRIASFTASSTASFAEEAIGFALNTVAKTRIENGDLFTPIGNLTSGIAIPGDSIAASVLVGNPNSSSSLEEADFLLYGFMAGRHTFGTEGDTTVESAFELRLDASDLTERSLLVGLVDTAVDGDGFSHLHFEILEEDTVLYAADFTEVEEALLFFEDTTLNTGLWFTNSSDEFIDLTIRFSALFSNSGDGFGFNVLAGTRPVPLPATVWLLLSCIGLLMRKRVST